MMMILLKPKLTIKRELALVLKSQHVSNRIRAFFGTLWLGYKRQLTQFEIQKKSSRAVFKQLSSATSLNDEHNVWS
jgi:hypothetical protein